MAEKHEVTGIVLPNDWDIQGRLIEVVLYGEDESEFVLTGENEKQLFAKCHHRVSCFGTKAMDNRGRWVLTVERFKVLGDEADCGYESEFDFGGVVGATFPRMWRN